MNNCFEQGEGLVFLFLNLWEMPVNQIIEQGLSNLLILLKRCKLKCSYSNM